MLKACTGLPDLHVAGPCELESSRVRAHLAQPQVTISRTVHELTNSSDKHSWLRGRYTAVLRTQAQATLESQLQATRVRDSADACEVARLTNFAQAETYMCNAAGAALVLMLFVAGSERGTRIDHQAKWRYGKQTARLRGRQKNELPPRSHQKRLRARICRQRFVRGTSRCSCLAQAREQAPMLLMVSCR